jgi:hypothetical protein
MKHFLLLFIIFVLCVPLMHSQSRDLQLAPDLIQKMTANNIHDFSDPSTLNIKIDLWGNITNPGKYIVPYYVSFYDVLSYAGGPLQNTEWDGIKLFRIKPDSSYSVTRLNLENLVDNDTKSVSKGMTLEAGDIILIPGSSKLRFLDYVYLSTAVVTLATFILYFFKK